MGKMAEVQRRLLEVSVHVALSSPFSSLCLPRPVGMASTLIDSFSHAVENGEDLWGLSGQEERGRKEGHRVLGKVMGSECSK